MPINQSKPLHAYNLAAWDLTELNDEGLQRYGSASNDKKDHALTLFFACTTVFFMGLSGYFYWKLKKHNVYHQDYNAQPDMHDSRKQRQDQKQANSYIDLKLRKESQPASTQGPEHTDSNVLNPENPLWSPSISEPNKWIDREHPNLIDSKGALTDKGTYQVYKVPDKLPCHSDFSYLDSGIWRSEDEPPKPFHLYKFSKNDDQIMAEVPATLMQKWIDGKITTIEFEKIVYSEMKTFWANRHWRQDRKYVDSWTSWRNDS